MEDIKNPRLYNLKEKTLPFLFRITHVPGKRHFTADNLSRYASGDPNPNKMDLPDDAHAASYSLVPTRLRWNQERRPKNNEEDHSHEAAAQEEHLTLGAMTTLSSIESVTWDNVREQTTSDPTMRQLHDTILMGFPEDSRSMPELTRIYHQYRSDLSIAEGVILYQDRIVIPPSLRDQVLETLHAAHQGVTSMNARAKASVFWPGITIQIQELRNYCQACHRIAPSNPKPPPTPSPDPVYPFQMICADYFCYGGHNYLVIVDRYSGWPYVCQLTGASPALVKKLRELFVTYGIGRICIRWRPRIHGRFHPAVPPRLGSCPPPLVGSLSEFQHPGRDRGQVSQAHVHGEHRTTRRRRYPGIPASYADVPEHAYAT